MIKNVLIISTSLRSNSNSEMLADSFGKGAEDAGHHVEKVTLKGKTIGFCRGCLACQTTGKCVLHDDAEAIVAKMCQADVLVFATPVYYYEMCGQMKTILDRANPLYIADYAFREVYLLASAAENEEYAMDGAVKGLQGFIDCFEKAQLAATVFAGGVDAPETIKGHKALDKAYEIGRKINAIQRI